MNGMFSEIQELNELNINNFNIKKLLIRIKCFYCFIYKKL